MKKIRLEEPLREFGFPLAGGLLVILITFFFLIPKIGEIFSLRGEMTKQKEEINRLSQKISDLKTLSEADLADSASLATEALPSQKDIFQTLSVVKKIFQDNGLLVESFKFSGSISSSSGQTKEAAGLISPLTLNVSFFSSFPNFKEMVKDIEKILPLMMVNGVRFGSLEATPSASLPNLSGKIDIISFSSPLPKVMGKADQPLAKISVADKKLIEELKTYLTFKEETLVEEGSPSGSLSVGKDNPFPF